LRVAGNVFGQKFEGDKTVKPGVLSLVDNAHTPAAQPLYYAIVRDRLPDHWRESYVGEKDQVNRSCEDQRVSMKLFSWPLPSLIRMTSARFQGSNPPACLRVFSPSAARIVEV
jgi:hypothetical protein